jgi:protoheme IX farnesyltransferase
MSGCWRLIRPGLLVAVLFSMAVAAVAIGETTDWPRLAHALLGTGLVIAGASAMNQILERRADAQMARTATRPLPAGSMTTRQVAVGATALSLVGIGYLAALSPPAVTLLAALSWAVYVLAYTPMKRASVWHMPVGAVAGAIPVLLGAATAGALFAPTSLAMFGMVFFWQFPHTAAIGWLYREQYAAGGAKVAAVVDPSGRLAGRVALFGAAGLLLVSLAPMAFASVAWPYGVVAVVFGLVDLASAGRFLQYPSDATARALWRVSLVHLPALLAVLLLSA